MSGPIILRTQSRVPAETLEHVSGDCQLDDANPAADFDIYAKARQAGSFCGTVEREKRVRRGSVVLALVALLTGAKGASGIAQQIVKPGKSAEAVHHAS